MSQTFVKSFTHLKGRPHEARALQFLQTVASLVKPIMRKHGWTLPVLSEFFPSNPSLLGLNINGGQKILLRLRPAHAPDTFYDEDHVVRTMLHELTHNVHGPHDDKFYKLLGELEDEYDALRRSGYAGEGFFSKGQRVGANVSHNVPIRLGRTKALEAAEKRRKVGEMMSGGGRLGGRPGASRLTPREAAAQAAERRKHDEIACGTGVDAQREAEKAARESVMDKVVIDLTEDSDEFTPVVSSIGSGSSMKVVSNKASSSRTFSDAPSSKKRRVESVPMADLAKPGEWTCHTCTLVNQPMALQCDACLSERPQDHLRGWTCMSCGESDNPHQFWACKFCGSIKTESTVVG